MNRAASSAAPRALADLSLGTIVASVEIEKPPERVFRALTDPSELMSWWGSPDTYTNTSWVADLRKGGKWLAQGVNVDGKPYSVGGEYLELDPPRTIVHTWQPDWHKGLSTVVTYRLEPIAGGTRVTMRHEGFAQRDAAATDHAKGWERVFGWLRAYLSGRA
jgi:uncharacterized protein YndB with AHSA1/START domain